MNDKEAADIVEEALNRVIPQMEGAQDGDILVEWVLVGYVANPEGNDAYPMLYSNGQMPTYSVRGLLHTGLEHINGIFVDETEEEDDDDD